MLFGAKPGAFSPFNSLIPISVGSKLSKVSNYTSSLPVTLAESTSKEKVTLILSPQTPSAPMAPRVTLDIKEKELENPAEPEYPAYLHLVQQVVAIGVNVLPPPPLVQPAP